MIKKVVTGDFDFPFGINFYMNSKQSFSDHLQHAATLEAAVLLLSPVYVPGDIKFTVAELASAIAVSTAATETVETLKIPLQDLVSDRAALVKAIRPLVTQAVGFVKSNTAWSDRFVAVKRVADKVRKVPSSKMEAGDGGPTGQARAKVEGSFVEIAAFFKTFVDRLISLPGYAPPDTKISTTELLALHTQFEAMNTARPTLADALADAITDRKETFLGPTGLKFVFDGVKTSVKGQYGQGSTQYGMVKGIRW